MRRQLNKFASLMLACLLCIIALPVCVHAERSGEWSYTELDDGSIEITRFDNYEAREVTIPSELDGKKVKKLGSGAFSNLTNLQSVTVSDGIEELGGSHLFSGCSSLSSITIPDSVTFIGHATFNSCTSLTSIEFPNSLKVIDGSAFEHCLNLSEVNIPDSVETIGEYAFVNCWALKEVKLPEGITRIEKGTFQGCSSLENITIPESVTYIADDAFIACGDLIFNVDKDSYAQQFCNDNGLRYETRKFDNLILIVSGIAVVTLLLVMFALVVYSRRRKTNQEIKKVENGIQHKGAQA